VRDREWNGRQVDEDRSGARPGGDVSSHCLWLLVPDRRRPVTMPLTGGRNPGDPLGLIAMETSNQGKMLPHLFQELMGPRKYL